MKFKTTTVNEIQHLIGSAKKEGIEIKETAKTRFLVAYNNMNDVMGFFGFEVRGGVGYLKSDYVLPVYRKNGILTEAIKIRLRIMSQFGIRKIFAMCTPMSLNRHLKHGATIVREYKNATKVYYSL